MKAWSRGLVHCGSLDNRGLSAGQAEWTETTCRPRDEPEGWINTNLMERASMWDRLTSGKTQPGGDMEPSRWANSGGTSEIIKHLQRGHLIRVETSERKHWTKQAAVFPPHPGINRHVGGSSFHCWIHGKLFLGLMWKCIDMHLITL